MVPYVRILTGPTIEPVTLAEARLWARVDDDDTTQDAMLLLLVAAAREKAEEITGRAFASRTLELRLDDFPEDGAAIELPYPPLQSVQYVTYATDDGDVSIGGSPDAFLTDTGSYPGRILPLDGADWPDTTAEIGAVRVGYTAGYANVTAMPKSARLWMQMRVTTLFDNRDQFVEGHIVQDIGRDFIDGLLDGLRVGRMFA